MNFTHVHQILPALHVADASGAHTLHARDALREAGYQSELFVDQVDAALEGEVHRYAELDGFVVPGKTALLYQLAVGSRLVDQLVKREEPLLVNYHNLTPASFYWKWAPDWLDAVALGRAQLYELAPLTSHAIAVSEFNEADLRASGYRSTSVVPPFAEVRQRGGATSPGHTLGTSWLFVGKLLPHKSAHDLVRGLAAYRKAYDPDARLVLIGGHPIASYAEAVRDYAKDLGLGEAVEMRGSTSAEELEAAYEAADVFVCASEHEGFCFPLLEAMSHGVPIVAYEAGAVAATVGDAGIVVRDKSGPPLAAAVHRAVSDRTLRERLGSEGRKRLGSFDLTATKRRFAEEIGRALDLVERDMQLEEANKRGEQRLERRFEVAPAPRQLPAQVQAQPQPVRAIHQLVPMLVPGDATSQHAIQLRKVLQVMGLESEIFATAIDDELHDEGLLLHELPDRKLPGTVLIYQMSSGSPMVEVAAARKERLWVNYHNVTPGWTYDRWEPAIAAEQRWGRRQVARLADRAEIAICDSAYNASELMSFGYRETFVSPVLVDFGRLGVPTSSESNGKTPLSSTFAGAEDADRWLFVGRIAPHKGQHRLVQTLAAYAKLYGTTPRLDLVGSVGSMRYAQAVKRCAEELGISERVRVSGGVDDAVLGAYYRNAGVLVSASLHEGFCVPIVEAMNEAVPVVALAAAAVPETAGDAALLVEEFAPSVMASAVHRVGDDANLRSRLVEAGRVRAAELSLERSRARMREVIGRCIDRGAGAGREPPLRRSA